MADRRLVLRREALTELTRDDLRAVVGGATVGNACGTGITVLVNGCPSDPRICEYATDLCH
jgi:hypothetical protein